MGESKRRRVAATRPVEYHDLVTDERRFAKSGGDPEAYVRRKRQGETVPVPCDGCTECCHSARIEVFPEREQPEHLAHLSVEIGDDGGLQLRKRADGACIHLGDAGCTVYEHRPHACREYDCRVWSLLGVADAFTGSHRSPFWAFQPRTPYGRVLLTAYQMTGTLAVAGFKQEGVTWTVGAVAERASAKLPEVIRALDGLSKASREDQIEALGYDPATMTQEQYLEAQKATLKALGLV